MNRPVVSRASTGIVGDLAGIRVGDDFPVRIMGVINLDSSSFYSGSVRKTTGSLLETALGMEASGADLIDIGARSTAPYRDSDISPRREEELLARALGTLVGRVKVPISADTARAGPAERALEEGAQVLNDPYGLAHADGQAIARLCGRFGSSLVITAHERDNPPSKMTRDPIKRVTAALRRSLAMARANGVEIGKTVVDPGVGFFSDSRISNVEWNSRVVSNLEALREFGRPVLVGVSRKKFIGTVAGGIPPEERLSGSLSATAIAVYNGAHVIRTHDVEETKQAILVASAMRRYRQKRLSR